MKQHLVCSQPPKLYQSLFAQSYARRLILPPNRMPNISFAGAKKRKTRHSGYIFRMSRQEPGSIQLALASSGLLSLVDELLLNIIDHIDNRRALCHLASTCTRFQGLVEPYIWRDLLVLTGSHARHITQALDSRDERVDYIRSLSIRYKVEYKEGIEELNHHIALMSRLKHLMLESPCPNNSEWRNGLFFDGYSRIDFTNLLASAVYPRAGLPLSMPMLQSLTLHAHGIGDQKFILGRAKAMFLSPTLRKITLSCLNFEADMDDDMVAKNQNTTPLQSLTLVECNVDVKFLDIILSLPKALKELSIEERLHVFDECKPSVDWEKRTSSPLFLTALQRQADSLQRLTHIGGLLEYIPPRVNDPEGPAKLRSLTSLEHLELGFESHLNYHLRHNGFPPSLKSLKFLDAALSISAGHDIRSMAAVAFRTITSIVTDCLPATTPPGFTIHLHFSDHSIFRLFVIAHPEEQNRLLSSLFLDRPAIYKIASILKSYNGRFLISRENFPSGTAYIPPYMYGEEEPMEEWMYDSDDYWRFIGIDYQVMDDEELRAQLKGQKRLRICTGCMARGLTVDQCKSLGVGSACQPCMRAHMVCRWDDIIGEEEAEAAEEAGLQQILH
ncbi:hypothetical protein HBI80_009580 [Parastagonospora nodorum]|nr:hypothetical protein HBH51_078070 [Parastagonospora nodorum]KAH4008007.1 hypothetical protein HBI10_005840 [Parastagonospora nodorum]KAH4023414.1 hypothetical protein HBI13_087550 [Parastagonospora nodorum]KAH4912710.1 hypothetical protein HBI80_009580 [Parastagonospora nodorum]KAH5440181.1 hypothetical protein HBI32_003470 [Parastagonospora nodorum]